MTEQEMQRLVDAGLSFPPFRITARNDLDFGAMPASQRPERVLNISFEGGASRDFAVEIKRSSGLANLRTAIMSAKALAYANANRALLPLVVVPYLRPQAIDELVREQVSGLDLSGNGVLYVPGAWFGYRTGAKNRNPETAPSASPYRGEQSIVCRALLSADAFENQAAIVKVLAEFKVNASTVSKVLTALAEDLLVTKKPRIAVQRRNDLLDRLAENYRPPVVRAMRRIRLDLTPAVKQRMAENAARSNLWYAVSSPERYTVAPSGTDTQRVLAGDGLRLMDGVDYREDDRFPTIELVDVDARFPFYGREFADGIWWTSALQEYLTLARSGKRERQIAESMRPRLVAPERA